MTDHLDIQYNAALSLRTICELAGGKCATFIHQYVPVDGDKYMVRHEREGCVFCDAADVVAEALEQYRQLAKEVVKR